MACGGCMGARKQFLSAARAWSPSGMVSAVGTAVAINADKLRGMTNEEITAKYGGQPAPTVSYATPYKRTT